MHGAAELRSAAPCPCHPASSDASPTALVLFFFVFGGGFTCRSFRIAPAGKPRHFNGWPRYTSCTRPFRRIRTITWQMTELGMRIQPPASCQGATRNGHRCSKHRDHSMAMSRESLALACSVRIKSTAPKQTWSASKQIERTLLCC
jgi:hypothetical protein